MNQLYPIIRRARRPLIAVDAAPPAPVVAADPVVSAPPVVPVVETIEPVTSSDVKTSPKRKAK